MILKFERWACRTRAAGSWRACLVIGQPDLIGGAHLDQFRPGLLHHIRQAEATADLDQLRAGDDDPPAVGLRRKHQQHCGSIVINHHGSFGAGQTLKQTLGMDQARAALAGFQVEFQVRVAARNRFDGLQSGARKRCPAQVRVQDHPAGVDDRQQCRGSPGFQEGSRYGEDVFPVRKGETFTR